MDKASKVVLVEVDDRGDPIRIFKPQKKAYQFPVESVNEFPKAFAVGMIRSKVFARAGCTPHIDGSCEWCGTSISWEKGRWNSGEMHEVLARGKMVFQGEQGEVSVANSVAICRNCHTSGPNAAHSDRRWHSAKLTRET